jgi:hypothetical protein
MAVSVGGFTTCEVLSYKSTSKQVKSQNLVARLKQQVRPSDFERGSLTIGTGAKFITDRGINDID